MSLDLSNLSSLLSQSWQEKPDTKDKISSVIIPIFEHATLGQGLILTQRSNHLKSHPGQISFPGGVLDTTDSSLLECALREWEEEMGVSRNLIRILGKHEELKTRTGFHITPFVGVYSGDFQFSHNKGEVDKIILLPFSKLQTASFYATYIPNQPTKTIAYYFDLEDGLLWGATCEMIIRFLEEYGNFQRKPKMVEANLHFPPFLNPKLL